MYQIHIGFKTTHDSDSNLIWKDQIFVSTQNWEDQICIPLRQKKKKKKKVVGYESFQPGHVIVALVEVERLAYQ